MGKRRYDVHHPLWHKRPDWFLALGVPRLYDDQDLRLSYVVWQEGVAPTVVIELLSPSTEAGDLGRFYPGPSSQAPADVATQPPDKFTVYERYLKVPHYITYSRHRQELRYFQLVGTVYQEQPLNDNPAALWLPDLSIGLGIWTGEFEGIERPWLRWCDRSGNWLLTDTEQERQAKEQALQRAEQLAQRLRDLGIDPEFCSSLLLWKDFGALAADPPPGAPSRRLGARGSAPEALPLPRPLATVE